jgi:hypothetical protein
MVDQADARPGSAEPLPGAAILHAVVGRTTLMPWRGREMSRFLRWTAGFLVLSVLTLPLAGCDAPASTREGDAAEALQHARDEFDVQQRVKDSLAVADEYPGTEAGADAVPDAEKLLLDGLQGEIGRVFEEELPTRDFITESMELNNLADMVAFLDMVPKSYDAAATRQAILEVSVKIAEDWASRIVEVGKDRVAWAKAMRSKGKSSAGYDDFGGGDTDAVRFGSDLLKRAGAPADLLAAYASIVKALDYGMSATPHASSTRVRGNTITSTYSLTQIKRCETGGKNLISRAAKIRALIDASR